MESGLYAIMPIMAERIVAILPELHEMYLLYPQRYEGAVQ
jgi:hypothetical protein